MYYNVGVANIINFVVAVSFISSIKLKKYAFN